DFHVTGVQTCALPICNAQTRGLLNTQRQRLMRQIETNLDNTLLHVYRDLSDQELSAFLAFTDSPAGQAYYQAALAALRAALAVRSEERRVGKEGRCRG